MILAFPFRIIRGWPRRLPDPCAHHQFQRRRHHLTRVLGYGRAFYDFASWWGLPLPVLLPLRAATL